ncbi:MAG TPA: papain-like cysteine protease family protein [Anaerolineales bacterium]
MEGMHKHRKTIQGTLLAGLIILSIASLAAAPGLGMRNAIAPTPTPTVPPFPRLLKVKTLLQSSYTSCGEAAITMAYNYANLEAPIEEQVVIDYAREQGYFTERRWPFTSPENMLKIAEHFSKDLRTGTVTTQDEGLAMLIDQLREGEPIIIDVLARFYDPDSPAHFILVTGVSRDPARGNAVMIHFNDPLSGNSRISRWDGNEGVWHAWKTNNDPGGSGWWLVIPPP